MTISKKKIKWLVYFCVNLSKIGFELILTSVYGRSAGLKETFKRKDTMGTKIISLKTVLRNAFSNKKFVTVLGVTSIAAGLMMMPGTQALADDLFKGGKTTINETFGKDSTVIWILYILEVMAAIFAYVKTKNLAVFGGIAAVIVFVNVVFGIIPGAGG